MLGKLRTYFNPTLKMDLVRMPADGESRKCLIGVPLELDLGADVARDERRDAVRHLPGEADGAHHERRPVQKLHDLVAATHRVELFDLSALHLEGVVVTIS